MKSLHANSRPLIAAGSALAFVLTTSLEAATLSGDQNIVPSGAEPGNLNIAGSLETAGNASVFGTFDFGVAAGDASWEGVILRYIAGTEKTAKFDLSDSSGSVLWRDNLGVAARDKMKLDANNQLSLYNTAGTAPMIVLNGGNGQINLTGTGSGVYANGTSVFTVGGTGNIVWDRPLGITNATISSSSTTGALTVAGGIGVGLDSYFNGIRIGKGKNNRDDNTALGQDTLFSNTTGIQNTALGKVALYQNTTGTSNTAVGVAALYLNTTGVENTAVGRQALCVNDIGSYNVAVGKSALHQGSGNYNVAVGVESQRYSLTGYSNCSLGHQTLWSITSGYRNVALGQSVLFNNNTGNSNIASGYRAMFSNTSGSSNIAVGVESLYQNVSGSNNIALGKAAGRYQANGTSTLTSPENSIYIGTNARGFSDSDDNSIVIGQTAIGEGANTTVIGNSSTLTTHLYGQTVADSLKSNGATDLNNQVVIEPAVAPETAVRAMRILADGTILIRPGGDLPMGEFTGGDLVGP